MPQQNSTDLYSLSSVQSAAPASGSTVAISNAISDILLALTPAGLLAALTIALPTAPWPGQRVTVNSTQAITALTINTSAGSIFSLVTTLAGNNFCTYQWDGANWRKVG